MIFDLRHALPLLERTPDVLEALLRDMPDAWTSGNEGPDTWSPREVVAHLIGGEKTDWMARLRIILAQGDDRRFIPFDRVGHIESRRGTPLNDLLAEFRALRQRNLAELRAFNLTGDQLRLTGVHPEFGSVTLEQLLSTWVAHDLGHLTQITRTMARQYREAVGPWKAYLSALRVDRHDYNLVMKKGVGIADLKAHLSEHLGTVRKGRTITVLDRGTPVARIVPYAEDALEIRKATRQPRDLPALPRSKKKTDSLAALLEDRRRR